MFAGREENEVTEVMELGRFKVKTGRLDAFLAKRKTMVEAAIRELPGLRRIELVKLDDGTWVDLVLWDDRASSEHALEHGPDIPAIGAWLNEIEADVEMIYGDIQDRAPGQDNRVTAR